MYRPPHRRTAASRTSGTSGSASTSTLSSFSKSSTGASTPQSTTTTTFPSISASGVPSGAPASSSGTELRFPAPVPAARQPPLPRTGMQARKDLSLPTAGNVRVPLSGSSSRSSSARPAFGRLATTPAPYCGPTSPIGGTLASPRSHTRQRRYPVPSEMEMLASVARSGGDGSEGDALKDFATQERFRAYIDEKIHQYHHADDESGAKNIVRLFRKLREGIIASGRTDKFAIEVFESSVRYAVIGRDAPQLLSALNGLVPDLYLAADAAHAERVKRGEPDKCMEVTARLEALRLALEAGEDVHGLGHTHIPREGEEGTHTAIDYGHGHGHGHGHDHGEENVHKHLFPGPGHNHRQDDYHPHPHEAYLHPYEEKRADLDHLHTPDPHNDNRSHFASMLLIYHLVHSPLPTFYATYAPLVAPRPRRLVQRDYAAELASGEADSEEEGPPNLVAPAKIVPPPPAARVPFTTPAHLRFSRGAARAMAPESFDALLFGRMVADTVAHPKVPHDHPEALERALLAWASPRVRDEAALRLRRAYISAGAGWVAHALNLHGDAGVMLWALANGYVVRDGVVHLR